MSGILACPVSRPSTLSNAPANLAPESRYPFLTDYLEAVQNPARVFADPDIQKANFALDHRGLPTAIAGSNAVVFRVTIGASTCALRFYTRKGVSSRKRYVAFDSYMAGNQLIDRVANVAWHDDAVWVNGATWPMLRADWIEGRNLDLYVGHLAENSDTVALCALADHWRELICALQQAQFAHGDLQHANVIVDLQGRLRLIDFDSVWIPSLRDQSPPTTIGHVNYQRPGRSADSIWGRWADTFSALVIYLSLVALAKEPMLWQSLYSGQNLLFERRDFYAPFKTATWQHLALVGDVEIARLVTTLQRCCALDWVAANSLERTIDQAWP